MAIPASIEKNIALPGVEQANFVKYLTAANLPISNSKTIAYQSLYHFLISKSSTVTATTLKFFNGTYDQALTNFPGNNFVLPQSQHFLVTAIQAGGWVATNAAGATPITVVRKGFTAINSQSVASKTFNLLFSATSTLTVNGIVMQKDIPLTVFDNTFQRPNRKTKRMMTSRGLNPRKMKSNIDVYILFVPHFHPHRGGYCYICCFSPSLLSA